MFMLLSINSFNMKKDFINIVPGNIGLRCVSGLTYNLFAVARTIWK